MGSVCLEWVTTQATRSQPIIWSDCYPHPVSGSGGPSECGRRKCVLGSRD